MRRAVVAVAVVCVTTLTAQAASLREYRGGFRKKLTDECARDRDSLIDNGSGPTTTAKGRTYVWVRRLPSVESSEVAAYDASSGTLVFVRMSSGDIVGVAPVPTDFGTPPTEIPGAKAFSSADAPEACKKK